MVNKATLEQVYLLVLRFKLPVFFHQCSVFIQLSLTLYTGCFTTLEHNCRSWFPRPLWWKTFIQTCVRFWTVTELWPFFNSRSRPRVNRVYSWRGHGLGLAVPVISTVGRNAGKVGWVRNARSSQPSGSLCCGQQWHFRKPALSTDKFKLKVISRS